MSVCVGEEQEDRRKNIPGLEEKYVPVWASQIWIICWETGLDTWIVKW